MVQDRSRYVKFVNNIILIKIANLVMASGLFYTPNSF